MTTSFQHRVATILSADVVGYSRLVAQNNELTVRELRSCTNIVNEIVGQHQGRLFGGSGDSFMIEHITPAQAVRCAVAIQSALRQHNNGLPEERRMWLRTGINVG